MKQLPKRLISLLLTGVIFSAMSAMAAEECSAGEQASVQVSPQQNTTDTIPPRSFVELDEQFQTAEGNWDIAKVYNTKSGIMLCYKAQGESTGGVSEPTVYHARRLSDGVFYSLDSWHDESATAHGQHDSKAGYMRFLDQSGLKNGQCYEYRIVYPDDAAMISRVATVCRLNQPSITKVGRNSGTARLSWKKNTKATGYKLYYSRRQDMSAAHSKVISSNTTKTTLSNLKKGKTYYVCMRLYKVVDGQKYFSAKSAVKKIRAAG